MAGDVYHPFPVLVTSGDQAVLAAGSNAGALAVGQIGVFDYETGLSINAAGAANVRNYFLAVGIDPDNVGSMTDINKSTGSFIQKNNGVSGKTSRCYSAPQNKIIDIKDFTAECETDYSVKIEFRNSEAYKNYGYNQVAKTYTITTDCCDCCEGCDSTNAFCGDLALKMFTEINNDNEQLVTAQLWDFDGGAVILEANLAAWLTANPTLCPGLKLTVNAQKVYSFCAVNLRYYHPRGTDAIVSLGAGFDCSKAVVETAQDLCYEEGAGRDVRQLEYKAGGWNGKPGPYRTGELIGQAFEQDFRYYSDQNGKYTMLSLTHEKKNKSAWLVYENDMATMIAVPCGEDTTTDALMPILDALTPNFDALTDDVAACNDSCNAPLKTETLTSATDGIG
jgi:hypothetical protein